LLAAFADHLKKKLLERLLRGFNRLNLDDALRNASIMKLRCADRGRKM